jgi:UAA transporter family
VHTEHRAAGSEKGPSYDCAETSDEMMRRAKRTTTGTDDADQAAGEEAAAAASANKMHGVVGGSTTNSPLPSPAFPLRHNAGAAPRQQQQQQLQLLLLQHSHTSDQHVINDSGRGAGGPNNAASAAASLLSASHSDSSSLSSSAAASSNGSPSNNNSKAGSDSDGCEDPSIGGDGPVRLLGFDLSHLGRRAQFLMCASGDVMFLLVYGCAQELLSVRVCSRKLGLFLASAQFAGYAVLACLLRQFVYPTGGGGGSGGAGGQKASPASVDYGGGGAAAGSSVPVLPRGPTTSVPLGLYVGLALLRVVDLGMSNLAMQYVNYPAKTLMMSSRVVCTMLFGVVLLRKAYRWTEYASAVCMCAGLALFLHADATSSAVFHHRGVLMLVVSLVCDAALANLSESTMRRFGVGPDEVRWQGPRLFWCQTRTSVVVVVPPQKKSVVLL